MANAAYRIFRCPVCTRRRRIVRVNTLESGGRRWAVYRCSQRHVFERELVTVERTVQIMRTRITPAIVDGMFRDDPLLQALKRAR